MASEHDLEYDNIPYQRYGHSAVAYEDCAYIWGGRNDSDGACNTLFQYDTGNHEILLGLNEYMCGSDFPTVPF